MLHQQSVLPNLTTTPDEELLIEHADNFFRVTVTENRWIPDHIKTGLFTKQVEFLCYEGREALYGGQAGGGKSVALLCSALQFVDEPGYSALILRRTFAQLAKADSILSKAQEWLINKAHWNGKEYKFTFPSGATLEFGHMDHELSVHNYQGGAWQFVGVDEVTQFSPQMLAYPRTRQRRLIGSAIPIRWRGGTNPGGISHDYVKARYIKDGEGTPVSVPGREYFPATLADNPHIDREEYTKTLIDSGTDPVTLAQLLEGDWDIVAGNMFNRGWFEFMKEHPQRTEGFRFCRYWDKAGTVSTSGDYSAGVLVMRDREGYYWILDVVRGKWNYGEREKVILATAQTDRLRFGHVLIRIEQEPGSGGKESAQRTVKMLAGFPVQAETMTGSKEVRAQPLASQAYAGNVRVLLRPWTEEFMNELTIFPGGQHDDQVDGASGGFNTLANAGMGDLANVGTSGRNILDDLPEGVFG